MCVCVLLRLRITGHQRIIRSQRSKRQKPPLSSPYMLSSGTFRRRMSSNNDNSDDQDQDVDNGKSAVYSRLAGDDNNCVPVQLTGGSRTHTSGRRRRRMRGGLLFIIIHTDNPRLWGSVGSLSLSASTNHSSSLCSLWFTWKTICAHIDVTGGDRVYGKVLCRSIFFSTRNQMGNRSMAFLMRPVAGLLLRKGYDQLTSKVNHLYL